MRKMEVSNILCPEFLMFIILKDITLCALCVSAVNCYKYNDKLNGKKMARND